MRIRELQEIRYQEGLSELRMAGLDSFERYTCVYISIGDPERFLSAIKNALRSADGKPFALDALD